MILESLSQMKNIESRGGVGGLGNFEIFESYGDVNVEIFVWTHEMFL